VRDVVVAGVGMTQFARHDKGVRPLAEEAVAEALGGAPEDLLLRDRPLLVAVVVWAVIPKPVPEAPELVRELLDRSGHDDRDQKPKRLVVDLGAYEVPRAPDRGPVTAPPQNRVPALAAAAPVPDRSGIFGAVRAAFVRNKGSHQHEFVEAPGGIGITRYICSECGYISIGVSETDSD